MAQEQPAFSPSGSEYAIAGNLPGDQTLPAVALDYTGGYLVWQDNTVDGDGLGIAAQRLGANMVKTGSAFRVNVLGAGDQEKPQVAVLNGGGAVFVWQGGRLGFQKVYARFLAASGLFITGDVLVSSYAGGYQVNPAVATLADGSVIVVWSSYGEDGSMQGVFGQRFAPTGARLGGEFPVNQWTANNQRTPAVAALTNGNFVVVWISELQRDSASVDVYARIFSSSTAAVSDELPLNTSTSNSCANPVVVGSAQGGFAVAWSQNDQAVRAVESDLHGFPAAPRSARSWDVFGRVFDANGVARSDAICLNTTTHGDQYAPRLAAFGGDYLALWTSLGQDGSWEGVYGRFWNGDASFSGDEFRANTTTLSRQMQPAVASDNHAQMLAVWTGWGPGLNAFDLYAQRYVTTNVLPVVTNSATSSWQDSASVLAARMRTLPLLSPPAAGALPGALLAAAGSYNGLFCGADGASVSSAGFFKATVTGRGGYSAKLMLGGRRYSVSGAFDSSGWATGTIRRSGLNSLTVSLQLDLSGGDQIRGCVTDGSWIADLLADRLVFNKTSNPAPQAGQYTLSLPGDADATNRPAGDGAGAVTVAPAGTLQWRGTLADGTKVSQKSAVSRQGYWPLYAALYRGGGLALGWMQFTNQADTDLSGQLVWINPGGAAARYYPAGFTNDIPTAGSRYTPPASGTRVLNLTNAVLHFSGGNLSAPFTNSIRLEPNNKITNLSSNRLSLGFAPACGLFKGSVLDPQTGTVYPVQGVWLEKENLGGGYFLGTNQSGKVRLKPAP